MAYSTIQQVTEETEVETAELQINAKMHQVAFSIFLGPYFPTWAKHVFCQKLKAIDSKL